jgi:hypothetical protein
VKPPRVLIVSLAGNLLLGIIWSTAHKSPPAAKNPPAPAMTAPAAAEAATPAKPVTPIPNPPSTPSWQMIESKDFAQYAANLRAVGCPEWVVRNVIVAGIDRFYHSSIQLTPAYSPPWQNADRQRADSRVQAGRESELESEKQALIKAALGYEWDNRDEEIWKQAIASSLILGFLPDETVSQVTALDEKYARAAESIRTDAHGILIDEDRARLQLLYQSLTAEKSRLLCPADLDELQLRGQAAGYFTAYEFHLDSVAVNDMELREITRYSQAVKDMARERFDAEGNVTEAERVRRQAAFEQQIETLLGPARFADYQRAQDSNFRETYGFIQQNNLPKTAAIGVYEARRAAEDQMREIAADTSLSPTEQAMALAVLKAATANAISDRLGGAYQNYLAGPGQWLKSLAVPPQSQTQGGAQ